MLFCYKNKKEKECDILPRQSRRKSITKVYHCIARGINKQDIFLDKQDFAKFKKELEFTKNIYSLDLYSYVLMSNHIHLQIKDEKDNLSQFMKSLQIRYVNYFNKKYDRIGHLFQDRFQSKNVENVNYFFNLLRYIHQNPVKARIAKVDKYEWSSYKDYISDAQELIANEQKTEVFGLLSDNPKEAVKKFINYNQEIITISNSEDLLEYEIKKNLTDEELIYWIKKELEIANMQEIQNYEKKKRNEIIARIKKIRGCNHEQIARILGISRRIIQRAK